METDRSLDQLPPAMPTLTFDIELGDQAHEIDFDYSAFYKLALGQGVSEEQINELSIHFSAGTKSRLLNLVGAAGTYRRKEHMITIFSNAYTAEAEYMQIVNDDGVVSNYGENLSEEERGNSILRHEAGHWVDHMLNGEEDNGYRDTLEIRQAIYSIAGRLAVGTTAILPLTFQRWELGLIPIPMYVGIFMTDYAVHTYRNAVNKSLNPFDAKNTPIEWPAYAFEAGTRDIALLSYTPKS